VQEARVLHAVCGSTDLGDDATRAVRGHIYVTLFGMYERCVSDCVYTAVYIANNLAIPVADLKQGFRLLALLPQFQGYRDCTMERSWPRGIQILETSGSSDAGILHAVFPADGSFMKPSQLELIWELFDLAGDPWPDPRLKGRIFEVVEARNDIAHGLQAASTRGAQLSNLEMLDRIDDFEGLCAHLLGEFSNQLASPAGFIR
jgi:hypothetical protein